MRAAACSSPGLSATRAATPAVQNLLAICTTRASNIATTHVSRSLHTSVTYKAWPQCARFIPPARTEHLVMARCCTAFDAAKFLETLQWGAPFRHTGHVSSL